MVGESAVIGGIDGEISRKMARAAEEAADVG
jgi:hypothetical protein